MDWCKEKARKLAKVFAVRRVSGPAIDESPDTVTMAEFLGKSDTGGERQLAVTSRTQNTMGSYHPDSRGQQALEYGTMALTVVGSVAGAVPVVGSPMKAVVDCLLGILSIIEQNSQNKEDARTLGERLLYLLQFLNPGSKPATAVLANIHQDRLVRQLADTYRKLEDSRKKSKLRSKAVVATLRQCRCDIDSFLIDYSVLRSDEREAWMREQMQEMQHMTAVVSGVVNLVDATGRTHRISTDFATTFEQFNATLQALFLRGSNEDRILAQFMKRGQYDMCIDEGTQVVHLNDRGDVWSRVQRGTTVVMRVVLFQDDGKTNRSPKRYQCPCCKTWNKIGAKYRELSIDCEKCDGRFEISETRRQNILDNSQDVQSSGLLKNVHIKQYGFQILWLPELLQEARDEFAEFLRPKRNLQHGK